MLKPSNRPAASWISSAQNRAVFSKYEPEVQTRNDGFVKPLLVTVAIVFLFVPLLKLGDYSLTVGTVMALLFVALTIFNPTTRYRFVSPLVVAIVLPAIIYALHSFMGTRYAIDLMRFILSYMLWSVSMVVIWASFQDNVFFSSAWIYKTLIVLTLLGAVQFVGALFFNIWWGYDLVAPLVRFDIYDSYLTLNVSEGIRAIGTYYEPSMFGRVVATLATVCLFQNYKIVPLLVILLVNIVTTKSLGLIVLAGLALLIYGAASFRQIAIVLVASLIGSVVFGDLIASRMQVNGDISNNSAYIRTTLPLDAIKQVLPEFPFGVPIGANAAVVQDTLVGLYPGLRELKITNGFYEFILYFGIISISVILWIAWNGLLSALSGRNKDAVIALFILMSTAASSSYLSVESSLLNYVLIAGVRASAIRSNRPVKERYGLAGIAPTWTPRRGGR